MASAEAERIPVTVLLLYGEEAHLATPHTALGEVERVPAARITAATGIPKDQLPGKHLVALVQDGELTGFTCE